MTRSGAPHASRSLGRQRAGVQQDRRAAGALAGQNVELVVADRQRLGGGRAQLRAQRQHAGGRRLGWAVFARVDGVEREPERARERRDDLADVPGQDADRHPLRRQQRQQLGAAVGQLGARDGVPFVTPHDGLGARAGLGVGADQLLQDRQARFQADLGADGVEVQGRIGQRPVQIEDDRARGFADHSTASAGPPLRATSSVLILPGSMPRARLVIVRSSSSTGGGSPLMNRSGFVRATMKLRR